MPDLAACSGFSPGMQASTFFAALSLTAICRVNGALQLLNSIAVIMGLCMRSLCGPSGSITHFVVSVCGCLGVGLRMTQVLAGCCKVLWWSRTCTDLANHRDA